MMRTHALATGLVALACAASAASGQSPRALLAGDSVQADRLNPGDVVRITVWRKPEISGDYSITQEGVLADPFYMDVRIAGVPLSSVVERIRAHVARYETDPRVLIQPLYHIAISGEVRQPKLYQLPPGTTVAQAVLVAGGLTERARADQVVLRRAQQRIKVDLTTEADGLGRMAVRSGDEIVAPRRGSGLRDFVVPASSVLAAALAAVNIWLRVR